MKPILFIDRDGVVLEEPASDYQVDSIHKTSFVPGAISYLSKIATEFGFYKVMVTNQDGLGTESFPMDTFQPFQDLMLRTLKGEGFVFDEVFVDATFPYDNKPTRKPGTGLVNHLINNVHYDISNSYVIGDRWSDIALAKNIGCKAIYLKSPLQGLILTPEQEQTLTPFIAFQASSWAEIYTFLKLGLRKVSHVRNTKETKISIELNLDGKGDAKIETGLGFFDHMLEQIARHGALDLNIKCDGDLHIDEHHTIEDVGIALGEAFALGLADKRGMERYGYALPMDESFSDAAKANLNISCKGDNEHHKIEAIFKAFAKSIKMAVKRNPDSDALPSTKGVL